MNRPIYKNNQGSTYAPFRIPSEGIDQKKNPTHESQDHGTSYSQKAAPAAVAPAVIAPVDAADAGALALTLQLRIL